jgi:hypothetical protein
VSVYTLHVEGLGSTPVRPGQDDVFDRLVDIEDPEVE